MRSALLADIGLAALIGLAGFGAGWWRASASHELKAVVTEQRAELQATEQLRTEEHHDAVTQITALDHYATAQQQRRPRLLAARGDLERLQQSALRLQAPAADAAAASACGPDPRLARVLELLREGAGLVEEGSRLADELRDQRDSLALTLADPHTAPNAP